MLQDLNSTVAAFATQIDQPAQNMYILPPGGKDADKENSSILLPCFDLGFSHLAAIYRTKGEVIYRMNIVFGSPFWLQLA